MWREHPALVALAMAVVDVSSNMHVTDHVDRAIAMAADRLATNTEGELPEIQAWRRAFSKMGLKPTQYRCASESLLRRFRKEGSLPRIHPIVDLTNAISLAFAIPIAVFDVARVSGFLEVRHAAGTETYVNFDGIIERPDPGEVIFVDDAGKAHARRWTHRQSAESIVRQDSTTVLVVAEAMHASAFRDIEILAREMRSAFETPTGSRIGKMAILSPSSPRLQVL